MKTPHVAAMMGYTVNPIGYTAINTSDVLSDEDKKDKLDLDVYDHVSTNTTTRLVQVYQHEG